MTDPAKLPAAGQPDGSAQPAATTRKKKRAPKVAPEAPKEVVEGMGSVKVNVIGPQNATVLIDDQPFGNWFGPARELPAGTHVFQFRPPNGDCCKGPDTKTVLVRPGEEQTVRGVIEWNPATLEFRGSPLSSASCGEFAQFSGPGTRTIPMQKATLHLTCNVIPPAQSGEAPKAFDLDLIPGRTSTFPRTP
jgi:hypothetical protein